MKTSSLLFIGLLLLSLFIYFMVRNKFISKWIGISVLIVAMIIVFYLSFIPEMYIFDGLRKIEYNIPNKTYIDSKLERHIDVLIPKNVFLTYNDLDGIPKNVIENIKTYCSGYNIEIFGPQQCENFLYEYFGPDAMQLYREMDKKSLFWCYCILYIKGGYYIDIQNVLNTHVDNILNVKNKKTFYICNSSFLASPPLNPLLWDMIINLYDNTIPFPISLSKNNWECIILKESDIFNVYDKWDKNTIEDKLYREHNNLPDTDINKLDVPILYINMDKDKDKRRYIENQLKDVENVFRIVKVDNDIKGCTIAHINAIKKIVDEGWDKALIIEDNVSFKLTSSWDKSLSKLITPSWLGPLSSAYLFDRKTCIYLLSNFQELETFSISIDNMLHNIYGHYYNCEIYNPYDSINKGIKHYPFIYNYIDGKSNTKNMCDIAISFIDKILHKTTMISINSNGEYYTKKESKKMAIISFLQVSDIDNKSINYLIDYYKNKFSIEVYLPKIKEIKKGIKYFECSYSNIKKQYFNKIVNISNCKTSLQGITKYCDYVQPTYVSLTTIPMRLSNDWFYQNIKRTMLISCDYTVFINIPDISTKGVKYIVPDNMKELEKENKLKLKLNYCGKDLGPITKLLPTLSNPDIPDDSIIIVCDDDIKYYEYIFSTIHDSVLNNPHCISVTCNDRIEGFQAYGFVKNRLKGILSLDIPTECKTIDDDVISSYVHYKEIPIKPLIICGFLKGASYNTRDVPDWDELRNEDRCKIREKCIPKLGKNLAKTGPGRKNFFYKLEKSIEIKIPD